MGREQWRPVVGYEGFYEVSNLGRVRNCKAARRILKQKTSPKGYKILKLYRHGVARTYRVHRLVLEAFVGPCPEGLEGCHWDTVPSNNSLANLRWDTRSANMLDSIRVRGTRQNAKIAPSSTSRRRRGGGD